MSSHCHLFPDAVPKAVFTLEWMAKMTSYEIDAAQLTIRANIFAGGATCVLATNSQDVADSFSRIHSFAETISESSFELNVLVDPLLLRDGLLNPHFRGMDHLVFAIFNGWETFVFDLDRNAVFGVVSVRTAQDSHFWNGVLLPVAVGLLGITMGIVPLHAACLDRNGEGLLLAGLSGAGKSTLAMGLTQRGFSLISDDWTYVTRHDGPLTAHGLRAPVKLLPDSNRFFPQIQAFRPHRSLNGEMAFEVDAEEVFGARVGLMSRPLRLLLLERVATSGCEFVPLIQDDVRRFFESTAERLSAEFASAAANRSNVIEKIAELDCWLLRSGASPSDTAEAVTRFCDGSAVKGTNTDAVGIEHSNAVPDLLKRFVDTPFQGIARVGNDDVVVRSNDPEIIEALQWGEITTGARRHSFVWKLVRDKDALSDSHETMSLANGAVVIARVGSACLAGIDYGRNELIAFLGSSCNSSSLQETVLPLLRELTLDAMSVRLSETHRLATAGNWP